MIKQIREFTKYFLIDFFIIFIFVTLYNKIMTTVNKNFNYAICNIFYRYRFITYDSNLIYSSSKLRSTQTSNIFYSQILNTLFVCNPYMCLSRSLISFYINQSRAKGGFVALFSPSVFSRILIFFYTDYVFFQDTSTLLSLLLLTILWYKYL